MRERVVRVLRPLRLPLGYGLLALLSFPTLEGLVFGQRGLGYSLDVFDLAGGVPRIGATVSQWTTWGPGLWDPYFGMGNDLLAQHSIAPVAPDVLLGFLIGSFPAYLVTTWLMAAVAGLGMHLYLRDTLRLPIAAVVVGAVVFLFGFWHYIYGFSALGVPIVLWLTDGALRRGGHRWRRIAGLVLFNGFVLYAGQSQVALIVGAVQLGWLALAATDLGRLRDRLGLWAGSWALSLALSGPLLLAQLAWLPISERASWNLADIYDARLLPAIGASISFYSSLLFGTTVAPGIGGSPDRYGTYFAGIAGLVLLAIGAWAAVRRPLNRRFAFVLALVVAIPVLDLAATLFTPIQQQLGFLRSFQLVRIRHVMPFVVATLVAIGAGRVLASGAAADLAVALRSVPTRSGWTRGRVAWSVVAALVGAAIVWQVASLGLRVATVVRRGGDLTVPDVGRLVVLASFAAGIVVLGLAAAAIARRRPIVGVILVAILVLVVADRALYGHGERFLNGSLGTYADEIALTPAQAFVQSQGPPETNRVLSLGLAGDRMGGVGIFQADGYQPIYPEGVHDLLGILTGPYLDTNPALYTYFHSWGVRGYAFGPGFDHEMADLMGIRWLIVRGGDNPGPGWEPAFRSGDDVVYANPTSLPRAFVASAIAPQGTRDAIVAGLSSATREQLAGTAFVLDADRAGLGGALPIAPDGTTRGAAIATYTPDRQELDIPDGPAGIVVLTDTTGPGWTATVDGVATPVTTVDLAFRGVAVGTGQHRIVLEYRPVASWAGIGLAVVGLLLTVAWAVFARRRDG
ncbi:MAG TPA: hypothetical protein VH440_01485, partial [Candidatus Limnocylindrales bacterium]